MKLSITTRLTITTAVLTAFVLLPAAMVFYRTASAGIANESARSAEGHARHLAFSALYQWDDDLMIEYKKGDAPLQDIQLNAEHWALVRGNGAVATAAGVLNDPIASTSLGESLVVESHGGHYRMASVPLINTSAETFEDFPGIDAVVRVASPRGKLLFAKRESGGEVEAVVLEPTGVLELEIPLIDGRMPLVHEQVKIKTETDKFPKHVPPDLVASIHGGTAKDVRFKSWLGYNAQLIAVIEGETAAGEPFELAMNRLGERFVLGEDGNVVGPDPAWRLWLTAAVDASAELQAVNKLLFSLALAVPVVWAAVVLIGWFVTRRALSPVKRIVDTVERIQVSHLDKRLPVSPARDELDGISVTINRMLDRLEEGYGRERQFTGDASHELRGPVAKFIAEIDVTLSKERNVTEYRETLARCRKYAVGMQRLVESLLWLARFDSKRTGLKTRPFELTDLIAEVARLFPPDDAARLRLDLNGGEAINVLGDPELIQVMVQNLIKNSLRYSPQETPVDIHLAANNGSAIVEVKDHGEGIPEPFLSRVFSRFYRVDQSRSRGTGGCGLGLSIVEEIATAHGFEVALRNVDGGGLLALCFAERVFRAARPVTGAC